MIINEKEYVEYECFVLPGACAIQLPFKSSFIVLVAMATSYY